MTVIEISKWMHIVGGAVALATFWLPWLVKKGAPLHRRAGWVFSVAMALISVSGVALCLGRLLDGAPGNDPGSVFLLFIALLSFASVSMGIRALRTRRRTGPLLAPWDLAMAAGLMLAGVTLTGWSVAIGRALFGIFGVLGAVSGGSQLFFWLRPPASRMESVLQHIAGMGTACIGTVTAFLVVNVRLLGIEQWAMVAWIAPGIVGGIGITAWQAYYRRKTNPGRLAVPA